MSDEIKCQQCDCEVDVSEDGEVTCGCPPEDEGPSCPDLILPMGHGCPLCGWHATHTLDGREILIEGVIGYPHIAWSVEEPIGVAIFAHGGKWSWVNEGQACDGEPIAIK